jgi:hypothetical protein
MAQHRVAHWPWAALAQGDSRARRAAAGSSLVWEQISSRKSGAPSWHVVPRLQERPLAEQMAEAAALPAWSLPEGAEEPALELQEQLKGAGRLVWEQQRARLPVLLEGVALQREQQASQRSPQVLEQVSALQVRTEQARQAQLPQEAARTQQEREERQQREEAVAQGLPRQASGALPWRQHLSRPFRPRLFARPRLPLQQRRGSACALSRLRRRRSNLNAFFSR